MYSAAQGPGSACGPADPEPIQANWGGGGGVYFISTAVAAAGKTDGESFDLQGKLLPQAPPVLFLGFHCVEKRQFDDVGPDSRTGATAQPAEERRK